MRIAFVSDVHVGNPTRFGGPVMSGINRRCQQILDVLQVAVDVAGSHNCGMLVVLGDLFDTVRPEPQIIVAVRDILATFNGEVVLLVGNHDQVSTDPGDHALGPLGGNKALVVEMPCLLKRPDVQLVVVPFLPGDAREEILRAVDKLLTNAMPGPRVLCFHAGVIDGHTPPWLKDAKDALPLEQVRDICQKHNIKAAFGGNWHTRNVWRGDAQPLVMQVGALVPTGWDNPGPYGYGTVALYDTMSRELDFKELPGPRFISANEMLEGTLDQADAAHGFGSQVYVQLRASGMGVPAGQAWLAEAKKAGRVIDGEVRPDSAESEAAARMAAHSARHAETLDESIANYVKTMEMPPGVDQAAVLMRVSNYMKG